MHYMKRITIIMAHAGGPMILRIGVSGFLLLALLLPVAANTLTFSDEWISPRNSERERRKETRYIILHTTEAASSSALQKLQLRGEAHYLIDETGRVFRIVDRHRIAYHCGRSMWDGRRNLDRISIGIEVAGYHDRELEDAQYHALAALLKKLRRIYNIPDDRVLTHSMVAYGAPNRWHSRDHRGRKRCGMQFAREDVRRRLGLRRRPLFDPDVQAGRLIHADPVLAAALFRPARPGAGGSHDAGGMPLVLGRDGNTPTAVAGTKWNRPCTLYFLTDGRLVLGNTLSEADARTLPTNTRVWIGYRIGGTVTRERRAFDISGPRWDAPDTFYLFPDETVISGDLADERRIPNGTRILIRAE